MKSVLVRRFGWGSIFERQEVVGNDFVVKDVVWLMNHPRHPRLRKLDFGDKCEVTSSNWLVLFGILGKPISPLQCCRSWGKAVDNSGQ